MGTRADHVPELDGLRALAAFAVVAYHCYQPWARGGGMGVDVFFVLSGWLITANLTREIERHGRIDFRKFMVRRVRRLFPAVALVVAVVVGADHRLWASGLAALTYTMDFLRPTQGYDDAFSHTWSLGVEMQFYFLWPWILSALLRYRRTTALLILGIAWLLTHVLWSAWDMAGLPGATAYYLPFFHCGGLMLGSALALAPRLRLPRWSGWAALASGAGLLILGDPSSLGNGVVALVELATAVVVLTPPALLRATPLPALGAISYGFYLWQRPWECTFQDGHGVPQIWPVACAALACTLISWWLVERPIMHWRPTPKVPTKDRQGELIEQAAERDGLLDLDGVRLLERPVFDT